MSRYKKESYCLRGVDDWGTGDGWDFGWGFGTGSGAGYGKGNGFGKGNDYGNDSGKGNGFGTDSGNGWGFGWGLGEQPVEKNCYGGGINHEYSDCKGEG